VVTATDDEATLVVALRLGADDFVSKPVKGLELLARIEALSRRARVATRAPLRAGRVVVEWTRRIVRVDDAPVELTVKEFDLAAYVMQHPGELLPRARLLEAVWGVSVKVDTRTVDTHASRVRRKLGLDGTSGWTLQSVYGVGYRLVPSQAT
jgi:DNA-binding response OmpR family regulator